MEGGGEIGGPSIIFGWNMGGLKLPKDDLGGGGGMVNGAYNRKFTVSSVILIC